MAVNIEVNKQGSENNLSLIRKFTRKVHASGILPRVRSTRYNSRKLSSYIKKKRALARIERLKKINELIKMGKISDTRGQNRRFKKKK